MNSPLPLRRLALAALLLCAVSPGTAAAQYGRRIASFNVASHTDESTGYDRDYAVTFPLAESRNGALFLLCGDEPGRFAAGFRLPEAGAEGAVRQVTWSLNGAAPEAATLRGTAGSRVWLVDDAQVDAFVARARTIERMSLFLPADSAGGRVEYVIFLPGADPALRALSCPSGADSAGVPSVRATVLALSAEPFLRDDGKLGSDPPPAGWMPRLLNVTEVQRYLQRNYPPDLANTGVTGSVELRVRILADGTAEMASARVLEATHPEFASVALKALERMRFDPAIRDGRPASVWVTIPLHFAAPT